LIFRASAIVAIIAVDSIVFAIVSIVLTIPPPFIISDLRIKGQYALGMGMPNGWGRMEIG
jgi:hypothetical protein